VGVLAGRALASVSGGTDLVARLAGVAGTLSGGSAKVATSVEAGDLGASGTIGVGLVARFAASGSASAHGSASGAVGNTAISARRPIGSKQETSVALAAHSGRISASHAISDGSTSIRAPCAGGIGMLEARN